jgi:hypothetical protein
MSNWPSIVPGTPEDYYLVVNDFCRLATAFAKTDLRRANLETTIADLMTGQHCDPLSNFGCISPQSTLPVSTMFESWLPMDSENLAWPTNASSSR